LWVGHLARRVGGVKADKAAYRGTFD
jgi:hypothetical protein